MAGRTRTTKKLSQRIDREYFKKVFPIPGMRRNLTYGLVGLGVLWLGFHAVARNQTPYSAGPIVSAHAMFGQSCTACHVKTVVFSKSVTKEACSSCHDGPIHQASQKYEPACVDCHVEHQSVAQLKHVSEKACTDCHANLETKSGSLTVVSKEGARISSFTDGHPEFIALRDNFKDPGTIKFNHNAHLAKEQRGPKGNVQLVCGDCHRPLGNNEAWPYGTPLVQAVGLEASNTTELRPAVFGSLAKPHSHVSPGAYMGPVDYYEHCSSCHPLYFSKHLTLVVPHKKPEFVHQFVVKSLTDYIAANPGAITDNDFIFEQIPTQFPRRGVARNAEEWVAWRTADAEQLLWQKTCKECHNLTLHLDKVPDVPKANITAKWMQKGEFDHTAHAMVKCEECHAQAKKSKETSDVLLPSIKSCQECHKTGTQNTAGAGCYECHQYHDWTKEKHVEGKFTIHEMVGRIVNK
jgi:hypothetical protein